MTPTENTSRRRSSGAAQAHDHGWDVESRHSTSAGLLLYVRCRVCGTRRVDVQEHVGLPPTPLSLALRSRHDRFSSATTAAIG